jgi:hypothetical protein
MAFDRWRSAACEQALGCVSRCVTKWCRPVSLCHGDEDLDPKVGDMASSTRIPKADITGGSGAMVKRISKKRRGEVPSPLGVYWNNRPALKDHFAISGKAQKWQACHLQPEVVPPHGGGVASGLNFGASTSDTSRSTTRTSTRRRRARCLVWGESDVFTLLERMVMASAEAMSQTPPRAARPTGIADNPARRSS